MKSITSPHQHTFHSNSRLNEYTDLCSQYKSYADFFDGDDQVPTLQKFTCIIESYLGKLNPKKRDKALINKHRYVQIQQVLNNPKNTTQSTAQFRFWVKKMFQLQKGSTNVVCHDNKPVVTKENMYDILVKSHREAHHGGRDKTSFIVRKKYSWVPKELIAQFVRNCPFCIIRRKSVTDPVIEKMTSTQHNRKSHSFDSDITSLYTDITTSEDSDIPSSINSYEPPTNYACIPSPPSPKNLGYSIFGQDGLIDCDYQLSFQQDILDTVYNPVSTHPLALSSDLLFYAPNDQNSYFDFSLYGYYPSEANTQKPTIGESLILPNTCPQTSSIDFLLHKNTNNFCM